MYIRSISSGFMTTTTGEVVDLSPPGKQRRRVEKGNGDENEDDLDVTRKHGNYLYPGPPFEDSEEDRVFSDKGRVRKNPTSNPVIGIGATRLNAYDETSEFRVSDGFPTGVVVTERQHFF